MERSFNLKQLPFELVWGPHRCCLQGRVGRPRAHHRGPAPTAPPACSGEAKPFPLVLVTETASVSLLFRFITCCDQRFICFSPGELKPTVVSLSMDPLLSIQGLYIHILYNRDLWKPAQSLGKREQAANTQTRK